MKHNSEHIDLLITRVLSGEANAEEIRELGLWMNNSDDNKKHFEHFKFVHEKTATSHIYKEYNADLAWKKLHSKMNAQKGTKTRKLSLHSSMLFRIAAGIAVVVAVSSLIHFILQPKNVEMIAFTAVDTVKTCVLADKSEISLNKNSEIIYPADFGKKNRKVKLKGEAFFNVQHINNKPFVIETDGVFIRDIGTSFNVKAYPDNTTVEVAVESGEVFFYTASGSGINLKQGESGIYNKKDSVFTMFITRENNLLAYKSNVFRFIDTPLSEVISQLNNVYNTNIRLANKKLANCRITVTFTNEKIDNIVQIISETIGLQVIVDDKGFTLKGNACSNE